MKNIVCLLLLSMMSCKSAGQVDINENTIDSLVSSLSWESFGVVVNYATEVKLNENSQQLVNFGKSASKNLYEVLSEKEKTVAAHLILTKIWEPEIFGIKICDTPVDEEITSIEYTINNLSWSRVSGSKSYDLRRNEMEKIISYWKSRISQ